MPATPDPRWIDAAEINSYFAADMNPGLLLLSVIEPDGSRRAALGGYSRVTGEWYEQGSCDATSPCVTHWLSASDVFPPLPQLPESSRLVHASGLVGHIDTETAYCKDTLTALDAVRQFLNFGAQRVIVESNPTATRAQQPKSYIRKRNRNLHTPPDQND